MFYETDKKYLFITKQKNKTKNKTKQNKNKIKKKFLFPRCMNEVSDCKFTLFLRNECNRPMHLHWICEIHKFRVSALNLWNKHQNLSSHAVFCHISELEINFCTHSQNFTSASKINSLKWNHCSLYLRSKSGPNILVFSWLVSRMDMSSWQK